MFSKEYRLKKKKKEKKDNNSTNLKVYKKGILANLH